DRDWGVAPSRASRSVQFRVFAGSGLYGASYCGLHIPCQSLLWISIQLLSVLVLSVLPVRVRFWVWFWHRVRLCVTWARVREPKCCGSGSIEAVCRDPVRGQGIRWRRAGRTKIAPRDYTFCTYHIIPPNTNVR